MKMKIPVRRSCISLIVLSALVEAIKANENENSTTVEGRQARVSGRIVKVYSGYKPDPVLCIDEGFKADPVQCAVFYRCSKSSSGKFTVFKFQCGPGTVYDPETEVCNHPSSTKRSECGGRKKIDNHDNDDENEINQHELPSPITTVLPVYIHGKNNATSYKVPIHPNLTTSGVFMSSVENGYINSLAISSTPYQAETTTKTTQHNYNPSTYPSADYKNPIQHKIISSTTSFPILEKRQPCISDGFMGDSEDCKKFYRCVSNLRGGFIRYEFVCSEPTVWDDYMQSCNHPWAVRNRRCGRGGINNEQQMDALHSSINKDNMLPEQSAVGYGDKFPKVPIQDTSNFNKRKESTAHYGDRISTVEKYNTEKNYISYGSHLDQPIISNEEKNIGTEDKIYHETTTQAVYSGNLANLPQFSDVGRVVICTHSGFIGDYNNCNKFYRCVENGKGSFTKYEFTCSQGTVWDKKLEACNYAWAVKECGGTFAVDSLVTADNQLTTTTTRSNGFSENFDNGYINPINQQHQFSTTITVSTPVSLISTSAASNKIGPECTATGFIGDNSDCKKFYRCIDNGRGTFTKYEYTCGDGTLWDQNIEACNHAWAVRSCNPSSLNSTMYVTSESTTETPTTGLLIQSTTTEKLQENIDVDESQKNETQPNLPNTTLAPKMSKKNDCSSTGFIGDTDDCKKFYRCISNGQRGFIKYEFSCGEGTVWDPEIEACNHPSDVKQCGSKIPLKQDLTSSTLASSYSTGNTNDLGITPTSSFIQSSTPQNEISDYDFGYGQQHSTSTERTDINLEKTTLKQTQSETNICQKSGFIGDSNNCNKFYRCTDNGSGGFIRHEFLCGEGTAWDPEIEACNHAWAVTHCGGSVPSNEIILTSSTTQLNIADSNNGYITQNYGDNETTTTSYNLQTSTVPYVIENSECTTSGFMGDKKDCNIFYRCVDNGNGTFIKYVFSCGEGTLWDSQINACNHAWAVKDCKKDSQDHHPDVISTKPTTNPSNDEILEGHVTPNNNNSDNISENTVTTSSITKLTTSHLIKKDCESSGFIGDDNDCQIFYRCVDNGNGGFIKHEFKCGEGTVWDGTIEACNHIWAVEKCGGNPHNQSVETTTHLLPSSPLSESEATATVSGTSSTSTTPVIHLPSHEVIGCNSEGFFANPNDCKKFYRCVDEGKDGFSKYDFSCAEGTAWDTKTQSCNYINEVEACHTNVYPHNTTETKPVYDEQIIESDTTKTTSLTSMSTTDSPKPVEQNTCKEEGYFGDKNDCKKFYRCVYENEKYTKYDFNCGDGTIWDQDIITCNHPHDVKNPSCKPEPQTSSSTSTSTTSTSNETPTPITTNKPSSTVTEITPNNNETNQISSSTTTVNPNSENFTCSKAGFYPNPNNCKKFCRCVDWDNNGKKFSIYHFECGDGTIWDPALETCNHEDSVYPPRNCNGTQETENTTEEITTATNQPESTTTSYEPTKTTTQSTTTGEHSSTQTTQSTTEEPTTQSLTTTSSTQSSTTEESTTQSSTTEEPTTQSVTTTSSTTEESTTQSTTQSSTTQSSTTEESTTSSSTTASSTTEPSTTDSSTTESSTTESSTTASSTTASSTTASATTESSTTEASTTESSTTETSTTQSSTTQPSTTEESTTQSSTTKETTTEESTSQQTTVGTTTTNEQTTSQLSTSTETDQEQTTKSSTTNEDTTTVESSTTSTQTTTSTTDQTLTTTEQSSTTTETSTSTTQNSQESTTQTSSNPCPDTAGDQSLYVCPTSFKRHPKYCNLFYQCTEDDSHELKIAVFNCPNSTIYDENKVQCVEEEKSSKKCDGQISQKHRVKRLGSTNDPFTVTKESMACRNAGHFPFEKHVDCSSSLLKCETTKSGKLRGFVYRCPDGFVYWSVSRRCEPIRKVRDCKRSSYPWKRRHDIPFEMFNIAP